MCGCSTHQVHPGKPIERDSTALAIRVDDMTCGHCAGTITRAVETGIPGTKVKADPTTKTVLVHGAADLSSLRALISGAGYTPGPASHDPAPTSEDSHELALHPAPRNCSCRGS
jgi:copper chaperone